MADVSTLKYGLSESKSDIGCMHLWISPKTSVQDYSKHDCMQLVEHISV